MELGEKLKKARLEAGLSQRQLCGDTITRNMLSQIENGSAKPSYTTLQILSSRLGKSVSFFADSVPSENLKLLYRASQAEPKEALELLKGYLAPDAMLEPWYRLLHTQCRLELAEQAVQENRIPYAQSLLREVTDCQSPRFLLLQYEAGMASAEELPDNTREQLLRANAALEQGNYKKCISLLDGADSQPERWYCLRGEALIAMEQYEQAAACFLHIEETKEICGRLELCYREMKNYEKAYEYACKQR